MLHAMANSLLPTPRSAPVALSIAGSDSGANAGIQADLLSFAANGVFGTTAITCLTAQNPQSVSAIHPAPVDFIVEQAEQVVRYFPVKAAKTGMLYNDAIIRAVAAFFRKHREILLVVDPVMVASSGQPLVEQNAIERLTTELLPLATVITPNLDEAGILLGGKIDSLESMRAAARELSERFGACVLIKGGHLTGDELHDVVGQPSGSVSQYTQSRITEIDTHGSGCTLSAAIAAKLAQGQTAIEAIEAGRRYLRDSMEQGLLLSGARFINHFPR